MPLPAHQEKTDQKKIPDAVSKPAMNLFVDQLSPQDHSGQQPGEKLGSRIEGHSGKEHLIRPGSEKEEKEAEEEEQAVPQGLAVLTAFRIFQEKRSSNLHHGKIRKKHPSLLRSRHYP
jgi:hypothetical protein